jgi:hypothetical protein
MNYRTALVCEKEEKTEKSLDVCLGRVIKREEESFDDCDNSDLLGTDREPLGTSWSKKGADVAVGEGSPRKEPSHKKEML